MVNKAVILARGLGTRMRKQDDSAALDDTTARVAATGVKAMIPTLGRPFMDFLLSTIADAGYRQVCLVIGPEHAEVREYYGKTLQARRLEIEFAVQEKPLGTADAVRPAEHFAGGEPFLMINSDNFYPPEALRRLHESTAPAIAVFERDAMLRGSNIAADRISKFSVVKINDDGTMKQIIEKPDDATLAAMGDEVYVSMNCWAFSANIFKACAAIKPSPRGEYEITDAAQYCVDVLGESLRVHRISAPVLDLSSRGDIASVTDKLRGIDVRL
ncbi:MAG: NTP transferase domain-containing protein [Burkholderiales bacterium]|nr:NTP transferase domain-containing protein [Phycisphaerae bacterium]